MLIRTYSNNLQVLFSRSERSCTCRLFLIDGKRRSERSYTFLRFHCPLPYYIEMSCNPNNSINTAPESKRVYVTRNCITKVKKTYCLYDYNGEIYVGKDQQVQIWTCQVLPEEWEQTLYYSKKGRYALRTLLASSSGISFHKDHGLCSQPTL